MEKIIAVLVLQILKPGSSAGGSVTFENPNLCALKGSSVEIRCTYNYAEGETVEKSAWYKGQQQQGTGIWTRVELSEFPSYQNRTKYLGDLQHDCSLAIHDLQLNDTGYYYFRFDTNKYGWRSKTSVYLSVTELNASVPQMVRVGDNVTLECRASCQPSRLVWFKDGRQVTKLEFQAQAEDAGNYLCAVEGQESFQSDPMALDVQYPPLNMSIEVSRPGSSVNLTCSSAANPAANYTWYRYDSSSSSLLYVGSGEVLSLLWVEESHAGVHLCQAKNGAGENNITTVLTVRETDVNHIKLFISIGVKVVIVALHSVVIMLVWRWKSKSGANKEEHDRDYEDISMASVV